MKKLTKIQNKCCTRISNLSKIVVSITSGIVRVLRKKIIASNQKGNSIEELYERLCLCSFTLFFHKKTNKYIVIEKTKFTVGQTKKKTKEFHNLLF
jgi:hypothetical protein